MQEDRKEQDALLKTLNKMIKNVKTIRKRQDNCWEQIKHALQQQEGGRTEEEGDSSQESQTQVWSFGGDNEFRAISEAEASVFGQTNEGDEEEANSHDLQPQIVRHPFPTFGPAPAQQNHERRGRASTGLHIDYMLELADVVVSDGETDNQTVREHTKTGTTSASRMPTPVTPGVPQRTSNRQESSEHEVPNPVSDRSREESPARSPPRPRTPQLVGASMRAPPSLVAKGKRKRNEKDWQPTMSSNRLKRRAKTSAMERTKELYEFNNKSVREQSQAFREESDNPWIHCGDCQKPTCKRCKERKAQSAYSTLVRLQ
jgi:hypothetical protein